MPAGSGRVPSPLRCAGPTRMPGERRSRAEHSKGIGEVEQILVLWEDQDPGADEIRDLIQSVEPGLDPVRVRVEKAQSPAISYGLASWHVHEGAVVTGERHLGDPRHRHALCGQLGPPPGHHRPGAPCG